MTREKVYAAVKRASEKSPAYAGGNAYNVPLAPSGVDGRTGNLGRSVLVEQDGLSSRITVKAYSKAGFPYGELVLGAADGSGQGRYFGHWPKLYDAIKAEYDQLTSGGDLDKALQDEAHQLGF